MGKDKINDDIGYLMGEFSRRGRAREEESFEKWFTRETLRKGRGWYISTRKNCSDLPESPKRQAIHSSTGVGRMKPEDECTVIDSYKIIDGKKVLFKTLVNKQEHEAEIAKKERDTALKQEIESLVKKSQAGYSRVPSVKIFIPKKKDDPKTKTRIREQAEVFCCVAGEFIRNEKRYPTRYELWHYYLGTEGHMTIEQQGFYKLFKDLVALEYHN